MIQQDTAINKTQEHTQAFIDEVRNDYRIVNESRQLSLVGRREVLSGKAKFGIFGDGKELVQVVLAKHYKNGDWRTGYYRDQTLMMAAGLFTLEEFFYQLYGVTDVALNPGNGGRSFNNHFSTRSLDNEGNWVDLTQQKNSAADLSPTSAQVPRTLGLAMASKLFRNHTEYSEFTKLSRGGNEIVFTTIGDASTSEGHFFEVMNALSIVQAPAIVSVYDDGYGISVEKKIQTVKGSISEALKGFEMKKGTNGIRIYKANGWNYTALIDTIGKAVTECREQHIPVLIHFEELTQPQGHSTSGSHERYKDDKRLAWEAAHDPIVKFREWILAEGILKKTELDKIEQEALADVERARETAWTNFQEPILAERNELLAIIEQKGCRCGNGNEKKIGVIKENLRNLESPIRRDNFSAAKKVLRTICHQCKKDTGFKSDLSQWLSRNHVNKYEKYSAHLYVESQFSAINVDEIKPIYSAKPEMVAGRQVIRDNYDKLFRKYPLLLAFGEDVGKIGGVNQTYEGLQEKYGLHRVFDTGIRETSILGKGIGLALRGFRPIAEIQYFDYLLYGLQALSDDVATTHWRTAAGQTVPLIISTRGHRLEGIWHSGSPLSMVINSIRGMFICVPRDMTRAAGFYNTLLKGQDPALVIEPLNGYRLKEPLPENLGEFTVPLGVPEVLISGSDVTLVTYGSCVRIAADAIKQLSEFRIHVELIDVQTLIPFDITEVIIRSIKKTGRVIFFDEDVPGGATAYMLQKVIEEQNGYRYLSAPPKTLTAMEHRPAYTTDGDYFSNPNVEDVFETVYNLMHQSNPQKFPELY